MNHRDYDGCPHRFYRDPERGLILGVCTGLADRFDCPVLLVRVVAVALGCFFTVPAIVAYLVAALFMPERPLRYYGRDDERAFWRSHGHRH